MSAPSTPDEPRPRVWQKRLARFFANPRTEIVIGALIVVSVAMTLLEFYWESSLPHAAGDARLAGLQLANELVTFAFVVELTLRWLASASTKRFLREYWIDILAVIPYFRVFRAARAVRLLRLLRVLRLFGFVSRLRMSYPELLRRGAIEYLMICGVLMMTVVFATGAILFFESGEVRAVGASAPGEPSDAEAPMTLYDAFWFSVYSLFAGEPIPDPLRTTGGRIVTVFVMFMGLTIFAIFTGTVSAFMVDRLRTEGNMAELDEFHNHVVICGWNNKAEIVLDEYLAAGLIRDTPIVVVAVFGGEPPLVKPEIRRQVHFLEDDFTRVAALEQAGVKRAKTCILLADTRDGRTDQDADARTILAALTVEKLNPAIYTCAELYHRSYGTHLEMGQVNDYVVSGEHSAFLLAHAAMNRGLMAVLGELLTFQRGNQFYRLPTPPEWVGKSYLDGFVELKCSRNAVLVAVRTADAEFRVNPDDHIFAVGDEIVVIAEQEIEW